jgi:hypothetical protein
MYVWMDGWMDGCACGRYSYVYGETPHVCMYMCVGMSNEEETRRCSSLQLGLGTREGIGLDWTGWHGILFYFNGHLI